MTWSAPAERLAVFRALVGLYALIYLAVRLPAFLEVAGRSSGFEPVGILWFLSEPLPAPLMTVLTAGTVLLAALFASGIRFRIVGPLFALSLLTVATYRSSFGRLLYFDNLLVLHVLILSFSRAADARIIARRSSDEGKTGDRAAGYIYGWPLRLCALATVATYVLAGVAKLRIGGAAWVDGSSLRNHVAFSAARFQVLGGSGSPLAVALLKQSFLFTPAAIATLVLELGAPLMFVRRLRTAWVSGLWVMHAAIAASMFVLFPYPLALVAFAPLYRLERLPGLLRAVAEKLPLRSRAEARSPRLR